GIFLLEDNNSIFAHDAGNLYQFSIDAVRKALKTGKGNATDIDKHLCSL
ncbi:unnamed protein product, partial [marine sediment metagenome]